MTPLPLGIISSVGGEPRHWIASITPYSTYFQSPIDTYVEESTNSIYVTHHGKSPLNNASNGGNSSATINKFSFAGQRIFHTTAGINKSSGSYSTKFNRILKGTNALYVAGSTNATSTSASAVPYIGTINASSGSIDQQFCYSSLTGSSSNGESSTIDSANNIYFANGQFDNAIRKFSSSGSMLFNKSYSEVGAPDGYFTGFIDIKNDSSNNIYLFGNRTNQTTSTNGVVVKLNSSGDILWSRIMYTTEIYSGAINPSTGDVYIVGSYGNKHNTSPGNYMLGLVIKINSSGNFSWARKISATVNSSFNHCIIDSSTGDIYISGVTAGTTSNGIIYKLNSSGSTLWSRRIYGVNQTSSYVNSMDISSEDFVAAIGITFTSNYIGFPMIFKLPKNGSLTGSYVVGSNTVVYTSAEHSLINQSDPSSTISIEVFSGSTSHSSSAPSHSIGTSGTGTQLKVIA